MAKRDNKLAQLCAQVRESVAMTLADSDDEVLLDLFVIDVVGAPDASRLLVQLQAPADTPPEAVREAVEAVRGRMRRDIADTIHRKRVPSLSFELRRG